MSITSSQFMYSLTLQPAGMIIHVCVGSFIPAPTGQPRQQQLIVARCERLSMHGVGRRSNDWQTILTHNTFGILRQIASVNIPGTPADFLIVTSDAGRIALLQYNVDKNRFDRIHLETYGKSGIRRTIPGMYLAVDPRGRCCMLAAPEKNKVVYILNRNQEQKVTISSPQEVNQPQTITFALCAVDANFQNPLFAALEVSCVDIDQDPTDISYDEREKMLVYYRVDLGLNHVVREWSAPVDYSANMLFQVPGGTVGPSGVIVCALGTITYRHYDHEPITLRIPRRSGPTENPDRDRRIVTGLAHILSRKKEKEKPFFLLLQTDDGDVFRLDLVLEVDDNNRKTGNVLELNLRYFDTLPVATSISVLKQDGCMFLAAETGDNHTYRFLALGDEDPVLCDSTETTPKTFLPHDNTNVTIWNTVPSSCPQISAKVDDLTGRDEMKIYSICGTGPRSALRTITYGLRVTEDIRGRLPGLPLNICTVTIDRFSPSDKYMVISFADETMFLEIFGKDTQRVFDTGLKENVRTIHIGSMGDFGIIQVWARGFRYFTGKNRKPADWMLPAHKSIFKACSNHQQLVLALSTGEILYFEVSQDMLSMQEYNQGPRNLYVDNAVRAITMGQVPEGRVRAPFLAVGLEDKSLHIFSLDPGGRMLEKTSVSLLTAAPTSIEMMPMEDSTGITNYLHVGLESGIYLRALLDDVTGELRDVRRWFLGPEEVKLAPLFIDGQRIMLACGYKTHLAYPHPETKACLVTPLDYDPLKDACMLKQEELGQVMLAITRHDLCRVSIPDLSNHILTKSIQLRHTPRAFCRHPEFPFLHIIQSDANTLPEALIKSLEETHGGAKDQQDQGSGLISNQRLQWPRGNNYWASCIQIVNPLARRNDEQILYTHHLEDNEAALCCAMVSFKNQDDETFLVVGTGKNMIGAGKPKVPNTVSPGYVHVYRILDAGKELEFIHKTEFASPIVAVMPFQGQLAMAVDNEVFMYDLGMKSLLRKARCRLPGVKIVSLDASGWRIVAGDIKQSVFFIMYDPLDEKKKLVPFADDSVARYTTASTMLDYDTVAGGDKFGNVWVVRCPREASDEADEPGTANLIKAKKGYLNGTPHRLVAQVHSFVQDIPKSIQKTRFVPGGQEVIFWAGLQGTLGIFAPFEQRDDVEFFVNLESQLRSEDKPLAGREHLVYRGYYQPPKGCVDGDLCERYFMLDRSKKESIAGELDTDVAVVERKISEMRTRVAF